MKKSIVILVAISFSQLIFAQSKTNFSLETQGGYEYNYFKSPKEIVMNGVRFNEDSLIANSSLQDIDLDFKYRYKWRRSRLRFSLNPAARFFYENSEDSYWSLSTSAKYDYKISQKVQFLANVNFKRMNRRGLDGAQDVLVNPLGYTNYGVSSGFDFSFFRNNETSIELFYNFRNFDTYGTRDLEFDEFGIKFLFLEGFRRNRLYHSYGIKGYLKKRLYETFNASDIDTEGRRDWSYLKLSPFYSYPLTKFFVIKAEFAFYKRIDVLVNRSGFDQYEPKLTLKFKNKRTKLYTNLSYCMRNYTHIPAKDNNGSIGQMVKYRYVNFGINAEQILWDKLSVVGIAYSRIRNTNNTNLEARSFRSYRNQYASIGLKWRF